MPWIHDVIGDAEALVVSEDIASIEDLVGKTHRHAVRVDRPLQPAGRARRTPGVSADDVNIIDSEPDDIYAAWATGDIDGAYVWNPNLAKIIAEGGHTLITSADLAAEGKTTYDLAVVRSGFAEEYPDAVETWVEQQDRAVALIQDDPDAAAELIATELNITVRGGAGPARRPRLRGGRRPDRHPTTSAVGWPRTCSPRPSSTRPSGRSTP